MIIKEDNNNYSVYKQKLMDLTEDYDDMLTLVEELIDYISDSDARNICKNLGIPISRR